MIEPSIVIDQIDYPLMTVAKGAFLMGTISGTNNAKSEEEEPQRKVTLPSYLMGQYPITNIQYHQFVDDTNCQTPAYVDGGVTIRQFIDAGAIDRVIITREGSHGHPS